MSRRPIVIEDKHRKVLSMERISTLDEMILLFEAHGIYEDEWEFEHKENGGIHFDFYCNWSREYIEDVLRCVKSKAYSSILITYKIHRIKGLFKRVKKEIKSFYEYGNNYIKENRI